MNGPGFLRAPGIAAAMLAGLIGLAYVSALDAGFTWDDRPVILEDARVRGLAPAWEILTRPYGSSVERDPLWRPVTVASYALDHALWGLSPRGFHATGVLLHLAVTLALWSVLRRALAGLGTDPEPAAWATAALFAVHPVHVEAVTWVTGRSDVLGALFAVLAFDLWLRHRAAEGGRSLAWLGGACGAYFLGLLSKEVVAGLPAVLLAWEWIRRRVAAPPPSGGSPAPGPGAPVPAALPWRPLLALAAVFAVYLLLRVAVLGRLGGGLALLDAWQFGAAERLRAAGAVLVDHLRLLLWPVRLAADYAVNRDPAVARAAGATPAAGFGLALAIAALPLAAFCSRRRPAVSLGLAWYALFLFPASNLVIPIGVLEAERLLYLPSAGFLLALAALAAGTGEPARRLLPVAVLILCLPLAARSFFRNLDWRDDGRLYRSMTEAEPGNPYAHVLLGTLLAERGATEEAEACFDRALRLRPDLADALIGRAEIRRRRGDLAGAVEDLNRALAFKPEARSRVARALALLEAGDAALARKELEAVAAERPGDPDAWNGLGAYHLIRRDDDAAALRAFERAVALRPGDAKFRSNRGLARFHAGDATGAVRDQEEALRLDPELADAHLRRGVILYNSGGDLGESERSLRAALRRMPGDAQAHNLIALILCARRDREGLGRQLQSMGDLRVPVRAEVLEEAAKLGR